MAARRGAEEPAVCSETHLPSHHHLPPSPWKASEDRFADLFICFAARDTDREDVSAVSGAQPTHPALVSIGLFGRKSPSSSSSNFFFLLFQRLAGIICQEDKLTSGSCEAPHSGVVSETPAYTDSWPSRRVRWTCSPLCLLHIYNSFFFFF